ncbi:MAG: class I SAM-dependent methyltransferase, partial [Bacteroidota bacterium]
MYERLDECPSCQHTEFSNDIICNDHLVSDESFVIVKCLNCGLRFTNPRPTPENIGKYYDSEDYASHKEKGKGLLDFVYNLARNFALKKKRSLIKRLHGAEGKLLDVGAGTGDFLKTMERGGWKVNGVELNDGAREITTGKISGSVFQSIDELTPKKEYDVITLWHVLEHMHDLRGTLKSLRKLLKKNGCVIVAVPNCDSWDAAHYKEMWAAYDVPRH